MSKKTVSNVVQTIKEWADYLKPCTDANDLVASGYGTALQVYDCEKGEFITIVCGQDISTPKETVSVLNTTGATCNPPSPNGFIYDTFQAGKRVTLDSLSYTAMFTANNKTMLYELFGVMRTYRIVATDANQTFWAFNAILTERQCVFTAGEEDTGMVEISVQPSGMPVMGQLVQS